MRKSLSTLGRACLALIALAQAAAASSPAAPPQEKNVVVISAHVSDDRTTLLNDGINKWSVTNTIVLTGYEGADVIVKGRVDSDAHTIQVLAVSRQRLAKTNHGDSAFRR